MLYLGCHLSSSKGFAAMGKTALTLGANTFQFFTRNPRGGAAKAADPADAAALCRMQSDGLLGPLVAHAPYTVLQILRLFMFSGPPVFFMLAFCGFVVYIEVCL